MHMWSEALKAVSRVAVLPTSVGSFELAITSCASSHVGPLTACHSGLIPKEWTRQRGLAGPNVQARFKISTDDHNGD
jgi:hypothetical protein